MFSSKSNKNLGIILAVLSVIVLIIFLTEDKTERTFRENLVEIDSAKVSEVIITSTSNGEVKLFKENNLWNVKLSDIKSVPIQPEKIKSLVNQLLEIKPKRLAARSEDKWKDFQVDSSGTRVIVKENGDTSLDLIIGKFSFQQPRTINTYVRLQNDVDVYEVDGFLQAVFNQNANSFRDGRLFTDEVTTTDWKNLEFKYPVDSSFQIININGGWKSVNNTLDSAKTDQYLNQLANLSSSNFIDDIEAESLANPIYTLKITLNKSGIISINAYQKDERIIISSSSNSHALLNGNENDFWKKIFIGENFLLP